MNSFAPCYDESTEEEEKFQREAEKSLLQVDQCVLENSPGRISGSMAHKLGECCFYNLDCETGCCTGDTCVVTFAPC